MTSLRSHFTSCDRRSGVLHHHDLLLPRAGLQLLIGGSSLGPVVFCERLIEYQSFARFHRLGVFKQLRWKNEYILVALLHLQRRRHPLGDEAASRANHIAAVSTPEDLTAVVVKAHEGERQDCPGVTIVRLNVLLDARALCSAVVRRNVWLWEVLKHWFALLVRGLDSLRRLQRLWRIFLGTLLLCELSPVSLPLLHAHVLGTC